MNTYLFNVGISLVPFAKVFILAYIGIILTRLIYNKWFANMYDESPLKNERFKSFQKDFTIYYWVIAIVICLLNSTNLPKHQIEDKTATVQKYIEQSKIEPSERVKIEDRMKQPKQTDAERKEEFEKVMKWN